MPSNLSADERAAVEKVRDALDRKDLSDKELVVFDDEPLYPGTLFKPGEPVTYGDLRTLLAVVARAGEPVAWKVEERIEEGGLIYNMFWFGDEPERAARIRERAKLHPHISIIPLYAHPADARDRGDASADTRRMDWLESNNEYAIGHPFVAGDSWHLFFNDDGKDVEAPTLRAAIDHAMHAAPAAPEDQ